MKFFRPTESTRFHIDFTWFEREGKDIKSLRHLLPAEYQDALAEELDGWVDLVDEQTGEVRSIPKVAYLVQRYRAHDEGFIARGMPIAEAAFRLLLLNSNQPMTAAEIAARLGRRPSEVLAQIGGRVVYNGIRPVVDEQAPVAQ